jgi:hypothetical protein
MLPDDVKINRITQDAKMNNDGTAVTQIRVDFSVGKHGPFSERFPKETYSAAARDEKLTQFANEVRTP